MVEGHSVHRVATLHRQRLVGKRFQATSPNGRFKDGAAAIDGKVFSRIEAVGKNLFAFFGSYCDNDREGNSEDDDLVVVCVHFGMAGAWSVFQGDDGEVPEPTKTNRLRLYHAAENITADLSAMTVIYGMGMDLYHTKRAKLGEDPLRDDANPERLWERIKLCKRSIGALIMDQSFFTGPGNIYRAEILFKAGIHPDTLGMELERQQFDEIWKHTVQLLQRGYQCGSILTVDPEEAKQLGQPKLRRYIYNMSHCPRCHSRIQTWDINSRTCYACPSCQPRIKIGFSSPSTAAATAASITPGSSSAKKTKDHVPFHSHCARESQEARLATSGPSGLSVAELRADLTRRAISFSPKAKKTELVRIYKSSVLTVGCSSNGHAALISPEAAAMEKAVANESLAVEHIAELAPSQARRARARAAAAVRQLDEATTGTAITPIKKRLRRRK